MKDIFYIKDTLANKLTYYHLLVFLVSLPFDMFYSECVLVSLLVHTLIHLNRQKILSIRLRMLLPASLYLLTIAGTIYSDDRPQAFHDWEKQLALLLFPLLFSLTPLDFSKYKVPLLKAFAFTCSIVVLYLFFDAWRVMRYNHLPASALFSISFTNHNFSTPINLHATYLSMYLALSMTVLLYLGIVSKKTEWRIIYGLCCMVLFAGIIQLSSRAVLIATFLIINIILPLFLSPRIRPARYMILSVSILIVCVGLFAAIAPLKNRFISELKEDLTLKDTRKADLLEPRVTRWVCAWNLIRLSPLYGYGTGSETNLLKEQYFEYHLYNSYIHELNAHNEYLSLLLKTGIPGLALYLYILFIGFKDAIRKKDIFFCSFLLIIFIVSFSENILDVNKGIFFFSFFLSLFMHASVPLHKGFQVPSRKKAVPAQSVH